jgi:hypothetical protein
MFIDKIYQEFDALAARTFEDNSLTIYRSDFFYHFFGEAISHEKALHCLHLGRRRMKKETWNSHGNGMCPRFIEHLKACTYAYLVQLSSGWEKDVGNAIAQETITLKFDDAVYVKKYDDIVFCGDGVLKEIAAHHKLANVKVYRHIDFDHLTHIDFIWGKEDHVKDFVAILRKETPEPVQIKLLQVAKMDQQCSFSILPTEIIVLITNIYVSTLFECRHLRDEIARGPSKS